MFATRRKRSSSAIGGFLGLVLAASLEPAFAGDSLYGKVTEVKRADLVTIDIGTGKLDVHIVGIDVPREGRAAEDAKRFVSEMVLEKNARLRLEYRGKDKEMVGRLQSDDPAVGIKDVGLELVRSGLVRRVKGYDYKYNELSAAEAEAQRAKRGLWASAQPR
jgi:endonuclease YncB( thermonuclease family)